MQSSPKAGFKNDLVIVIYLQSSGKWTRCEDTNTAVWMMDNKRFNRILLISKFPSQAGTHIHRTFFASTLDMASEAIFTFREETTPQPGLT